MRFCAVMNNRLLPEKVLIVTSQIVGDRLYE